MAYEIEAMLQDFKSDDCKFIHKYFERNNGIEGVCIPEMKRLFDVFRNHKKPDYKALVKEYEL